MIFRFTLLCLLVPLLSFSQSDYHDQAHHDEFKHGLHSEKRHFLGVLLSHTFLPVVLDDEDEEWAIFPSIGLSYGYEVKDNFILGVRADLILETFVVNASGNDELIERKMPLGVMVAGLYEFNNGLAPVLGVGIELEENESFPLLHGALEYGCNMSSKLTAVGEVAVDYRVGGYVSTTLGLGLAYRL
jgi:hypothetical protein